MAKFIIVLAVCIAAAVAGEVAEKMETSETGYYGLTHGIHHPGYYASPYNTYLGHNGAYANAAYANAAYAPAHYATHAYGAYAPHTAGYYGNNYYGNQLGYGRSVWGNQYGHNWANNWAGNNVVYA